ncbi:MAG: hypothetical protein GY861_17960 [bacterium]|nr:hypothetical protein [bacterium]
MKNLNEINEVTVTYLETPADLYELTALNIGLPSCFEVTKPNLISFIRNCLKKEIFEIEEFKITETRPCE